MISWLSRSVFIILLAWVPSAALSDSADAFHAAAASAYGHYREAVFYAKRGNAMSAAFELDGMASAWQSVVSKYRAAPPPSYAADTRWQSSLDQITQRIDAGRAAAAAGDAKATSIALAPVRDALADLRRRNGVVIFSDHIEAANRTFRALFHFRRQPPDFTDAAQVKDLRARLTAVIKAYEHCRDKAPPATAANEQFQRLIKDSLFYLNRIWVAIDEKNQLNVVNILRRVVSSDDILWLRFG